MNTFDIENGRKHAGMPAQAMPVERHIAGAAAVSGDVGAEASGFWDTLQGIAKTALPIVTGLL